MQAIGNNLPLWHDVSAFEPEAYPPVERGNGMDFSKAGTGNRCLESGDTLTQRPAVSATPRIDPGPRNHPSHGPCIGSLTAPSAAVMPDINWNNALGLDATNAAAVYYDGLTVRNAAGKALPDVAQALEARIGKALQEQGYDPEPGQVVQLRRQIVGDPTLSLQPPPDIAYGSLRWIHLWTGMRMLARYGLDPRGRPVDEMIALGRAAVGEPGLGQTDRPRADLGGLLLMAHAGGWLDLRNLATTDAQTLSVHLGRLALHTFADELEMMDSLIWLAGQSLPTRQQIASDNLRAAGFDPQHLIDVKSIRLPAAFGPLSITIPSPFTLYRQTLCDFYSDRDVISADDLPSVAAVAAPATQARAELQASLSEKFARRFDAYKDQASWHITRALDASISLYAERHALDTHEASITISTAHRLSGELYVDASLRHETLDIIEVEKNESRGYFISIATAGDTQRFFFSFSTGTLLPLPPHAATDQWAGDHSELIFGKADADSPLLPGQVRQYQLTDIAVAKRSNDDRSSFVSAIKPAIADTIEAKRDQARGHTTTELLREAERSLLPGYATYQAVRHGAGVLETLATALLDVVVFIPAIGEGLALGKGAGRALLAGVQAAVEEMPRTGLVRAVQAGTANAAKAGPALGRQGLDMLRGMVQGALVDPNDILALLRGAGGLARAGIEKLVPRLREKYPALARDLETAARAQGLAGTADAHGARPGSSADVAVEAVAPPHVQSSVYPPATDVLERHRVVEPLQLDTLRSIVPADDGTITLNSKTYARIADDYLEIAPAHATTSPQYPVWRIVQNAAYRLDYRVPELTWDPARKAWGSAAPPRLKGGGNMHAMLNSSTAQAARHSGFSDLLIAHVRAGASHQQIDRLKRLIADIDANPRGKVILRALHAHYEVLAAMPEIVLKDGRDAVFSRPSLARRVHGNIWSLDLESLTAGPVEAAVDELAAVYNNMTGILAGWDVFERLLARGGPPLDPGLEQAWQKWLAEGGEASRTSQLGDQRRSHAVNHLRQELREMRCYGGVSRPTLESVLRNRARTGLHGMTVDLSGFSLDSIPPLPKEVEALDVAQNSITDWRNLPAGLKVLNAASNNLRKLPGKLPDSLERLDLSLNNLTRLPETLPPRLLSLNVGYNELTGLPTALPGNLEQLNAGVNQITRIPALLPPGLKQLHIPRNRIAELPIRLPNGLEILDVSHNALARLSRLPAALRTLDVHANVLELLPADLPSTLEEIIAHDNRLHALPRHLPLGLRELTLQRNQLTWLPPNIVTLRSCEIHLQSNPIRSVDIPRLPDGQHGPRIRFYDINSGDGRPRGLVQALSPWLDIEDAQSVSRWRAIEEIAGDNPGVVAFRQFLDRLSGMAWFQDEAFRREIREWLVELSKPERQPLRTETFSACLGAADTCEDRITWTVNQVKVLRQNDDIRLGRYDHHVSEVVETARQMFHLDVLADVARRKVALSQETDELEVYLAYTVMLKDALSLKDVMPGMRYFSITGLTREDLRAALETVRERERTEFFPYLAMQYEPWQNLLRRKIPARYEKAMKELHERLEGRFETELQAELGKLKLDSTEPGILEDARKDLGPIIMRQLRLDVLEPLTREYLASIGVSLPGGQR